MALWSMIPYCLMWDIWWEQNARTFERRETSIFDLKLLFFKTLFEWVNDSGSSFDSLLEMIDIGVPAIHFFFTWLCFLFPFNNKLFTYQKEEKQDENHLFYYWSLPLRILFFTYKKKIMIPCGAYLKMYLLKDIFIITNTTLRF